nr:hypothetical protein L204_03955 [Cryptococcus depauperatus CBS 7855]
MDKKSEPQKDKPIPGAAGIFGPMKYLIFLPILATAIWFAGLSALLFMWINAGRPRYDKNVASVAFISCFDLPTDKLALTLSCLAIFSCFIGCAGLFTLANWNCYDYKTVHWYGTLTFILGTAGSASFQSFEVWALRTAHRNRKHLTRNTIVKMLCVGADIALAIAFGGTYTYCYGAATASHGHTASQCSRMTSTAADLEWTIAYGLNLYFLTLAADLWPAGKEKNNLDSEKGHNEGHNEESSDGESSDGGSIKKMYVQR